MAGEIFHVPRTAEDRPHRDPYAAVLHGGDPRPETPEDRLDRAVETAVERAIFGGSELARRHFLRLVGAGTAMAVIRSLFPLETAKAPAQEVGGRASG
jgi:nitrate/nitrite transport system substrate-binding protein